MNEIGEVIVSRYYEPDWMRERLRIDRADPKAEIDGALLRQICADECEPWATVTNEQPLVITLADDYGQRFLYRIGERDAVRDVYAMEWPD